MTTGTFDLAAHASAIAAALSTCGPWTATSNANHGDNSYTFTAATGQRFMVYVSAKRLVVTALWPRDVKGTSYNPSSYDLSSGRFTGAPDITVSLDKTPDKVAKEIERRFLGTFIVAYAEQTARASEADAYQSRRTSAIQRLAAEAGGKVRGDGDSATVDFSMGKAGYVARLQVNGDTVQFELRSVPVDKAIAILNLLHGHK